MIFVQIYIKILGFGQKTILMRVDLFEIILSETSEICLFFFGISLGYDGETNILNESSVAAFRCFSALQMLIFMTSELKIRKNGRFKNSIFRFQM